MMKPGIYMLIVCIAFAEFSLGETLPAFPGAEGFGAHTPGGRGGKVLIVTTLEDYRERGKEKPIPGSLRAAVETEGPRIVVFAVSGTIDLKAPLVVAKPFLTLAGQTAPGGGICLRHYNVQISTHDVIVRHLRIRLGDHAEKPLDALEVYKGQNVIIDHCSASWSVDETLSVSGAGCTNVTVQWCLITESLNQSKHDKGEHGFGSLIKADGDITFHHNLYAHHRGRCPRPGTYGEPRGVLLDFRNNVIYDWVTTAGYSAEDKATLNYVGNYVKPGPSTTDSKAAFRIGRGETLMFVADNFLHGDDLSATDNWRMIQRHEARHRADKALAVAAVATDTAAEAYRRILADAGATLPARDAVDLRVIEQVRTGTGHIINSPDDVGGWPSLASTVAPGDVDHDGIADAWEIAHDLDPADPADNATLMPSGYTAIEEYINGLAVAAP